MSTKAASTLMVQARHLVADSLADCVDGDRVVVACSGGPDSLALAAVASWVARRMGLTSTAVVVDHGLQDDSAAVASWAAEVATRLGIDEAIVSRVTVGREGGPEAAARSARYAALEAAAVERGARVILLGHTMDDQAETVLLRLARGSGSRSLSAMREASGPFRRPWLTLRRDQVRAVADELLTPLGEVPWADPHNVDPAFLRVRVRRVLADLEDALGSSAVLSLARSADLLRDDADALDTWTEQARTQIVAIADAEVSASVEDLLALPRAVRTRVIRWMARAAGCVHPDAEHVDRVDALVANWHGQGAANLPDGVIAERAYGRLCLRPARLETE